MKRDYERQRPKIKKSSVKRGKKKLTFSLWITIKDSGYQSDRNCVDINVAKIKVKKK